MADIPHLIEQITDNDAKIRDKARAELIKIGSDAVVPLISALDSPNEWQRRSVNLVLQSIKDKRVIQPLLDRLKDPESRVRGAAAMALAEHQEQSALPIIQQLVENESDSFARMTLVQAVNKLGARDWVLRYATRVLTESSFNNNDRQAIMQVLVRLKDPATADLMYTVFIKGEFSVSRYALDALKEFKDPRAVDALIEQLKDKEPHKRANAAAMLSDFGDARAVEPIKALLGDRAIAWEGERPGEPNTSVDQAARDALKKLGVAVEPSAVSNKPRWKFW